MATVVTVGGTPVSVPRTLVPLQLRPHVRKGVPTFTFAVRGGALPASAGADPYIGRAVTVTVNGTLYFNGRCEQRQARHVGGLGWVRTYQCYGLRWSGDLVPHTDSLNAGLDSSAYNQAADNQSGDWLGARAGRTAGQIITDVLLAQANADALDAAGCGAYTSLSPPTLPAATTADLAALTVIPPSPVTLGGEKLLSAVEGFLGQWAPNHTMHVEPDGTLRFFDLRTYSNHQFALNTDPILPPSFAVDTSACYSRALVRGERVAEMFNLGLRNGGLDETLFAHDGLTSSQAKTAFRAADYLRPGLPAGQATATGSLSGGGLASALTVTNGGYNYSSAPSVVILGNGTGATATASITSGVVTSLTRTAAGSGYTGTVTVVIAAPTAANGDAGSCTCPSTTTLTVTSANKAARWVANFWDQTSGGRKGVIFACETAGTGITAYAQRRIVSCGALTPGGTCTITVDRALPHTNYDSYVIAGETGGASAVYTMYRVANSTVRASLAPQSTFPFAFKFSGGEATTLVSTPLGTVATDPDGNGIPPFQEVSAGVTVDRSNGTVRFAYPTYLTAGSHEPYDVRALVPVYVASNEAVHPPDSGGAVHGGTAHTQYGITRTLVVTVRAWRDPGNLSAMTAYASDLYDSVSGTVVEGDLVYLGLYEPALAPGLAVSVTGNGYALELDAAAVPNTETTLEWGVSPGDAMNYRTTIGLSSRRAHYTAEAFLKPDSTGSTLADLPEFDPAGVWRQQFPGGGNEGGKTKGVA